MDGTSTSNVVDDSVGRLWAVGAVALCQSHRCAEGLRHLAYAAQRNPSLPMLANESGVELLELGAIHARFD